MDFKKSLKAFKFVDINKDLYEYVATFGANLKEIFFSVSSLAKYIYENRK